MAKITSILCVTSAIIAQIVNIFILELNYILIIRLIFLMKNKNEPSTSRLMDVCYVTSKVEAQREALCNQLGEKLLRRPLQQEYPELNNEDIKVIKIIFKTVT